MSTENHVAQDNSLPMVWDVTAPASLSNFVKKTFEGLFSGEHNFLFKEGFIATNELMGVILQRDEKVGKTNFPIFRHNGLGRDDSIVKLFFPFKNDERARSIWRAIGETLQMSQDSPFIRIVILDHACRKVNHIWTGRFRLSTMDFGSDGDRCTAEFTTLLMYNSPDALSIMQKDLDAKWESMLDRYREDMPREFQNTWIADANA